MIVLKFGGTSVGTVESLKNVYKIVTSMKEPAIVVVSALGGLTDKLIETAKKAAAGDATYKDELPAIAKRHHDIIGALVTDDKKETVTAAVDTLLGELFRLYDGVALIADLPVKTLDAIVSFGERMSSIIVAGIIPGARHHNSPDFIKTEKWFDKNIAETKLTNRLIREEFAGDQQWPAIIGGFISSDHTTGEITNLGRGGSDYTAADPRLIPSARLIPEMSFVESMELCTFGAKVIYPPTIYPVFHKNIPIKIRNTFRPESACTLITDHAPEQSSPVTGISSLKATALLRMTGELCRNVAEINTRCFNALARHGISVFLVGQSKSDSEFSFALGQADADKAIKTLREEFAPELTRGSLTDIAVTEGLSTIAVVGENIIRLEGIDTRILNALIANGINPLASSGSNSKTTVTFVVKAEQTNDAIALIHSIFF